MTYSERYRLLRYHCCYIGSRGRSSLLPSRESCKTCRMAGVKRITWPTTTAGAVEGFHTAIWWLQVAQDRSVWPHLPQVFQGMWLAWEEHGDSNPGADAANDANRLAFVESLVSQSAASRRDGSAASSQAQPVEENGVTTGNGSPHGPSSEPKVWTELLPPEPCYWSVNRTLQLTAVE